MTVNTGGTLYEEKVLAVIRPQISKIPGIKIRPGTSTAGFASNEPDLQLDVFGEIVNIEIKMDNKAQMGGGSFNYDTSRGFYKSDKTKIDVDVENVILNKLSEKTHDVDRVVDFVKKYDIGILANKVNGLPLRATKDMWTVITSKGLLRPLNVDIDVGIDFLYNHYANKNCYYIQIGNAGLFYLKKNPLQLSIPQLTSKFVVELRLGRSGSSYVATIGKNVASGNMRAQGRMKGRVTSPYSLDKPTHFTTLFESVKDSKKHK